MADERGLEGLDPCDLMDRESERLADWFAGQDDAGWSTPSACEGWSRRDVLAHLVAVEEYFAACLGWTVGALMERYMKSGASSLDDFNAAGVDSAAGRSGEDLLAAWLEQNAENRAGWRAAQGGDVDTSVGGYPARLQAFHVAFEYAIHGNDVDVPVDAVERDGRQDWLARVAQFALTEVRGDTSVEPIDGGFSVTRGDETVRLDRDDFVDGVSGRAESGALGDAEALLDLGY